MKGPMCPCASVFIRYHFLPVSTQVAALRSLLEQRFPDAVQIAQHSTARMPTGIAQLDRALPSGGFPLGRLTVWEPGGGATSIMRAACSTAVANGDRAAWIDVAGTIAGAFWEEGPLLVRPKGRVHALRAVDELLRSGGFRLVVLAGERAGEPSFFRDVDLVRLVRSAHDGGSAFVALTQLSTMAALRIAARIAPDQYRWSRDPFGDPAEVQDVRIRTQVRALGWNARAEFPIPVQSHELRLSLEPGLADRRGLPRGPRTED
jgi:hypothetical protein